MSQFIINVPEIEKKAFLEKVGHGQAGAAIRHFIRAIIEKNDDVEESIKRRRFEEIKLKKEQIDAEYALIKADIERIDEKHKQELMAQEAAFEKERQKMADIKHDSLKAELYKKV